MKPDKETVANFLATFFTVSVLSIGLSILMMYPVKWLWNWIMPNIFGLTSITVWEAWGISMLANLIFGKVNTK